MFFAFESVLFYCLATLIVPQCLTQLFVSAHQIAVVLDELDSVAVTLGCSTIIRANLLADETDDDDESNAWQIYDIFFAGVISVILGMGSMIQMAVRYPTFVNLPELLPNNDVHHADDDFNHESTKNDSHPNGNVNLESFSDDENEDGTETIFEWFRRTVADVWDEIRPVLNHGMMNLKLSCVSPLKFLWKTVIVGSFIFLKQNVIRGIAFIFAPLAEFKFFTNEIPAVSKCLNLNTPACDDTNVTENVTFNEELDDDDDDDDMSSVDAPPSYDESQIPLSSIVTYDTDDDESNDVVPAPPHSHSHSESEYTDDSAYEELCRLKEKVVFIYPEDEPDVIYPSKKGTAKKFPLPSSGSPVYPLIHFTPNLAFRRRCQQVDSIMMDHICENDDENDVCPRRPIRFQDVDATIYTPDQEKLLLMFAVICSLRGCRY